MLLFSEIDSCEVIVFVPLLTVKEKDGYNHTIIKDDVNL